jgi:hypothetical protein
MGRKAEYLGMGLPWYLCVCPGDVVELCAWSFAFTLETTYSGILTIVVYSEYKVFGKYTCIEIIVPSYLIALCCPA